MAQRTRNGYLFSLAATALTAGIGGAILGSQLKHPMVLEKAAVASPLPPPALPSPEGSTLQKNAADFRAVARTVGPSVITIKSKHEAPSRHFGRQKGAQSQEGMQEFLEQFGFSAPRREGSGSGFIIDKNGTLVTNYHVVKGATQVSVLLDDESEEIPAKILGTDPRTDLAVLKIETDRPLTAVEWADSDSVEVGDAAIAIGSPFMLTHSVTAGIVSAKGRNASRLMGADFGYELLQTDAAINPGNSGGPLCSADGKVIGVNTAIYTQSGGYMGIGFAIPSNLANKIVQTLLKDGKVVRGWLGVAIQPLNNEMRKEFGIETGVVVHEVQENSPADKAGIHAGDAIVQIGDRKVSKVEEVQRLITTYRPGDSIALNLVNYRDGKRRQVLVKIGSLSEKMTEERG